MAILVGQSRYAEAEARGILHAIARRAHLETELTALAMLAAALDGQGRYEEALAEARRLSPVGRADRAALGLGSARALHGLGRRSEAEAIACQALTACEQLLSPAHPRIQDARTPLTRITTEDPAPE